MARSKGNNKEDTNGNTGISPADERLLNEGKIPPHSLEIEMNLLGGLIIDNSLIDTVLSFNISPSYFYKAANALIYKAVIDLHDRREPVDLITLTEELKVRGELDALGGPYYLTELTTSFTSSETVSYSSQKIVEYWLKRDLINVTSSIRDKCFDPTANTDELLNTAQREILDITNALQRKKYSLLRDEINITMEYVESIHEKHASVIGVPSGYRELDALTGGFQKSELIIIAGRPSHGKTAFALSAARNAAVEHDQPIGIFSIEMSNRELALRFLCAEAKVDIAKLKTGRLPEKDWHKIAENFHKLTRDTTKILIDDSSPLGLLELRAKARRMKAEHNVSMIMVDYLQLMEVSGSRMMDRYLEIGYITRGLKQLSKELDIPVVALSQLSRKVEDRGGKDKRPMLSDLRESGCLAGDTLITDAITGKRITIKELAERKQQHPINVLALDDNLKVLRHQMIKVFYSGKKTVYEIKTRTGRTIKASANHPFLKLQGWTRLDELNAGDKIAMARNLRIDVNENKMSDEEVILLAHLIGDGCILERQPYHYTSADLENIKTVKSASKILFNIEGKTVKQKNWYHFYLTSPYHLTHNKKHPLTLWFEKLGLKRVRSYEKVLPEAVFQVNTHTISVFLKHLWATDGNISWKKPSNGRKLSVAVYYATSSKVLAEQVQHLLLRQEIQSTIKSVENKKGYRIMYHVIVSGTDNQLKYLKRVGCAGDRGKEIPKMVKALEEIAVNPNTDIIPIEAWENIVKVCKNEIGISWRQFACNINMSYCGSSFFKNGISRQRMMNIYKILPFKIIRDLSQSDIYWDEITSIKRVGVQDVYDATVDDVHNFTANDLIVHNSIEQDADVVIFINRPEVYLSKDDPKFNDFSGLAEIIVGKQRNGPIGEIKLAFIHNYARFEELEKRAEPEYYSSQETPF